MAVNQSWLLPVDELRARLGYWLRLDPARLLWPRQCLACGDPGLEGLDLCGACAAQWPRLAGACAGCALPLPQSGLCGACLRRRGYDQALELARPLARALELPCL